MVTNFRNNVVFVRDPTALPKSVEHAQSVDALARSYKLVILLSHGNKYSFPDGWILPSNVELLEYDLEMSSVQAGVVKLRDILRRHAIEVRSRHLDKRDPMPLVLAGSVITVPVGTDVSFVNNESDFPTIQDLELPTTGTNTEWDL